MLPILLLIAACASQDTTPPDRTPTRQLTGLHHENPETRAKVIDQLLEGGRGSAEDRIIWEMHRPVDPDAPPPEHDFGQRLQKMDREGLADLTERHLRDAACTARPAMALALGQLGPALALHRLFPFARDPDVEVRRATIAALGATPTRDSVRTLVEALNDADPEVRTSALDTLIAFHQAGVSSEQIQATFVRLVEDDDPARRALGVEATGRVEGMEARDFLVSTLGDPAAEVRLAALRALGELGDRSLGEVIAPFLKDTDSRVREAAAASMGSLGTSEQVLPLIELLKDGEEGVRLAAISSLGQLRDGRALVGLSATLKNESPEEVAAAAWALGQIGDGRATQPLLEALEAREERDVLFATVGALGNLRAREAAKPLMRVLNDPDPEVKKQVAMALGQIGDPSSGEPIVYLLRGEREDVRIVALKALGILDHRQAGAILRRLVGEKDANVAYFAAATLFRFGDETGRAVLDGAVPGAIEMLRSDSSDDRFQGIDRLAYLAGDDFGYNPSSPAEGRRAAISAIEEWWKEQSRTEESPEPGR